MATAAVNMPAAGDGFTLIETVIVMGLVALLVSLAVPGYQQFQQRVNRADAVASLMTVALCQQRVYSTEGRYDPNRCLPAAQAHYRFSYPQAAATGFSVLAEPLAGQRQDRCGALMLDHLGRRSSVLAGEANNDCWSAR